VADFDHERVIAETIEQISEVSNRARLAVKRKRKLHQDRAEFVRIAKNVEARADVFFILRRRAGLVREALPELRSEKEAWIGLDLREPEPAVVGPHGRVEGGVDFDRVKPLRQISGFVKSARPLFRIEDA